MGREILLILEQFGAGGGAGSDPHNNAVRFLLAAFFWLGLVLLAAQEHRRVGGRRDLYIAVAAGLGLSRELLMFLLEYGSFRGWFPAPFSNRTFPPLEHTLTDLGRAFLCYAYLGYFAVRRESLRPFLAVTAGTFLALYPVTALGWARFLDRYVAEHGGLAGSEFALYGGDLAYRIAASVMIAAAIALLARARRAGSRIPPQLFVGLFFLFLDEFLMVVNIGVGFMAWRDVVSPTRHNLGIWAIPFFHWTYWSEVVSRARAEGQKSRQAELVARASEERYRTLAENIDLGITLIDSQFRVHMANPAQERIIRRPAAELIGRECFRALHGRDAPCAECPGAVAMETGQKAAVEKSGVRGDGTAAWALIQAFPVRGPDGEPAGFIEVVEDVTEARRSREERRRLEERVTQAQKLESLGILAGGIAHDFNNLLMGILGNADLALAKVVPESPARPFIQAIDKAAERAADLTNQMLAYSGKGRFVIEPISLTRLVREMGHLLATVVSKGAVLRCDLAEDLPAVEADATQVRQVVMNLIINASDALGAAEGTIRVSTGVVEADAGYLAATSLDEVLKPGRHVYLEVSDSGTGMDEATRARMFDPFYTTKQMGRGLGLAAVLGIVRGHRGAIRVYSEPGRGTTVKVLLPAPEGVGAPRPRDAAAAAAATPVRVAGAVLLADDEETVRATSRAMLEEAGFEVLTAADGAEAVEIFAGRRGGIAIVVLDMTMPRMGGEEAFREIRRIDPGVRVILSSGFNEQDAVSRFSGKGLAGFIQKPYRMRDLVRKIRDALGAGPDVP